MSRWLLALALLTATCALMPWDLLYGALFAGALLVLAARRQAAEVLPGGRP